MIKIYDRAKVYDSVQNTISTESIRFLMKVNNHLIRIYDPVFRRIRASKIFIFHIKLKVYDLGKIHYKNESVCSIVYFERNDR